jgi:hypothetical protein
MEKNQRSNNKFVLFDLLFFVALPYIIWNFGREPFGDYVAMLISTVPGFIYTLYRFILEKQFNITGIFILSSLALGTTVDLLAGSAEQMIWNGVYLSVFYSFLHLIALTIKRPLALYFAIDFAYLQGHARADSKSLFYQKGIFKWFQLIQVVFVVRGIVMGGLTAILLQKYGVDGYGNMLVYKKMAGWIFSGLLMGLYIYVTIAIRKYFAKQQALPENPTNALQPTNSVGD